MQKFFWLILAFVILTQPASAGIFDDRTRYSQIPFLMIKMLNLPSSGTPGAAIKPPNSPTPASPTPGAGTPTVVPGSKQANINGQGITGRSQFTPGSSSLYQLQLEFTITRAVSDRENINIWLNKGNEYLAGPQIAGPQPAGNRAQGEFRDIVDRMDYTILVAIDPDTLPPDAGGPSGEIIHQVPQQIIGASSFGSNSNTNNQTMSQKQSVFKRLLNSLQSLF